MERGGAALDEHAVLGVDRDGHAEARRGAIEVEVHGRLLGEAGRDHEHLQPCEAVLGQPRQLGEHRIGRIGDDAVEREVAGRDLRVAHRALDAAAQRTILLVDHRHDRRHAAGDRRAATGREAVERRPRRGRREMGMEIHAARQHEEAGGVELALGGGHASHADDALAVDEHVRAPALLRRDDRPAANGDGHVSRPSPRDVRGGRPRPAGSAHR